MRKVGERLKGAGNQFGSPRRGSVVPLSPVLIRHYVLLGARPRSYIGAMHLDLSDNEAAALTQELHAIIQNDRYPLSRRIRALRGIRQGRAPSASRNSKTRMARYRFGTDFQPPRAITIQLISDLR
jgi:hypothetical protein